MILVHKNTRKAFTMIELIFVIVIIGILASVAIPKLAASRDDAKISTALMNLNSCIRDIGSFYTSRFQELNTTAACETVAREGCFIIGDVQISSPDGNITVYHASSSAFWCKNAQTSAEEENLSQGTSLTDGQVHSFGGTKVSRSHL